MGPWFQAQVFSSHPWLKLNVSLIHTQPPYQINFWWSRFWISNIDKEWYSPHKAFSWTLVWWEPAPVCHGSSDALRLPETLPQDLEGGHEGRILIQFFMFIHSLSIGLAVGDFFPYLWTCHCTFPYTNEQTLVYYASSISLICSFCSHHRNISQLDCLISPIYPSPVSEISVFRHMHNFHAWLMPLLPHLHKTEPDIVCFHYPHW